MSKNENLRYENVTEKIPTINIRFREAWKDRNGKSIVQLVVHLDGKKMTFNTGVKVVPEHWDNVKEKVKSKEPEHEDLNLIINTSKAKLNNIFVKYRLQDKQLTYELIKNEYERPNMGFDFLTWMEQEIEERRGEVTDSTASQFRAHLMKLKSFKKKVAFADLSSDFFALFNRHMINKLKNNSNTRWNTLKTFRTFMNIAKRKGIITYNPLDRMPVKRAQTDRIFLDESEVKKLIELYHKKSLGDNLQGVLRHFLFSCHTGLRISDLVRIRQEDILRDMLILVPHKTKNSSGITVRIPLVPFAVQLVKDEAERRVNGMVFKTLSEQKMRLYLKDIVAYAKIKKTVNFHSGRHTFATLFLKKTKNVAALQKLLGHQNINQTMVYAHILTDDLEHEMDIFGSA